ncbi:MAG: hypothetical protein IKP62_12880 [Salinivirgaceae bacterium]|nr:hypothetical protein [Salinivirgaceae bacterium]
MKKLFIFSMLTLIFGQLSAQDLIVTKNGDSIQCKIETIKHNNIYYHTEVTDGATLPKALPKSEVKKYKYGYYNQNVDDGSPKDLIITNNGDSIRCKIKYRKYDYLYYTTAGDNTDKYLSINDLNNYKYNYYRPRFTDYHRVVISFNGGYSSPTPRTAGSRFTDHNKHIKKGYHLEGDLVYYFSEHLGLGAKCSVFKSSHSQVIRTSEGHLGYRPISSWPYTQYILDQTWYTFKDIRVKDEYSIPYIGPMVSSRFYGAKKQGSILVNYSIGYLKFSDEKTEGENTYTITGNALGHFVDLGYDYWIHENAALGIRLSLSCGTLKRYSVESHITKEKTKVKLNKDEYEGLGRIDISAGLRFGGKKMKK